MILKTLVQAVFFIQVIRISALAEDGAQEEAMMIMNTLKKLEDDGSIPVTNILQNSQNSYPQYLDDLNKDMNFDMFQEFHEKAPTYHKDIANTKSKRGWEDVSLVWRKSPKRAWEFINKLWKDPVIRRKYKTYLDNGKRSDELMENIPVQQNNVNPLWILDAIENEGIDLNHPIVSNNAGDDAIYLAKSSKRGWEAVNPARWKNTFINKPSNIANIGKRGWEEINWKRSLKGQIRNNLVLDENADVNQLTEYRPEIIDTMQSDYLSSNTDTTLDKKEKHNINPLSDESNIFSKSFLEKRFLIDFGKLKEKNVGLPKVERGYDLSKRSSFENLCRMLVGDLTKCRESQYFV